MNHKLASLKKLLSEEQLDAILISSPALIVYLTGYAGFSSYEREAYLFITSSKQFVFTDGRYSEAVKKEIPYFELLERATNFSVTFKSVIKQLYIKEVGFEDENLTVAEFERFQKYFTLYPVSLEDIRCIKTPDELSLIQQACTIGDQAFSHIKSVIKATMTEKELADELEWFIRKRGGTLSFPTIVAFSENSAIPHHHTGNKKLQKNDVILLDFGVKYQNYCSDMTRTFFIGEIPKTYKDIYEIVEKAQASAVTYVANSLIKNESPKASVADKVARLEILKEGFVPFSHALGHGIGIDVHEAPTLSPSSDYTLSDGMVFSIEPGIYLPGKMGVRIEDLFTITNGSLKQLTHSPTTMST